MVFLSISLSASGKLPPIANPELMKGFSSAQKRAISENGFFLTPSKVSQIYEIYEKAKREQTPIFVTADCLLHTFHIIFDYALRTTESEYFYNFLQTLSKDLVNYELSLSKRELPRKTREALLKNIAFFSVGASLLSPGFQPPKQVRSLVKEELKKIENHRGFEESAIFGYKEDYSQYIPRGHYTRNEKFKRYFITMMWYGRMGFYLKPGKREKDIKQGRNLTRQAILICDVLKNAKYLSLWKSIYEPTAFFVGRTDDLSILDYLPIISKVFSKEILKEVADDSKIDEFIRRVEKLPAPKILSDYLPDTLRFGETTKGFKFMGQRFIPDSYIFQELVYDKVGTRDNPRLFPKGLDVMAVLGSKRAYEILDRVYKETGYRNYVTQFRKLRKNFDTLSVKTWNQSIYFGWLYTLKLLLEPQKSPNLPFFMHRPAYQDKTLVSSLGSWTELRHDTILYAKQSYTLALTALPPKPPPLPGYVEPYLEVYAQIEKLTKRFLSLLKEYNILNSEAGAKLRELGRLSTSLKSISEKELQREKLTEEEKGEIRDIGETLKYLTTFSQEFREEFLSETDKSMEVIADVHTDPNTKRVLEEGVGEPFVIYTIVPIEGKHYIAQGGIFSYYEFIQPMDKRLTDEEWQRLSPKPEMPKWMKNLVIE